MEREKKLFNVATIKMIAISRLKKLNPKAYKKVCCIDSKKWIDMPIQHWYCPMLEGQICEVCCAHDMDASDWPRGLFPDICEKDYDCSFRKKAEEWNANPKNKNKIQLRKLDD